MIVVQNEELLDLMQRRYSSEHQIRDICDLLSENGTFDFSPLQNGLFSAAITREETEYTGYQSVWVRDNIYIAYAHYKTGRQEAALKNLNTLFNYFQKHRMRFERIVQSPDIAEHVMERPHIRFDGETLSELEEDWSHAQNDALGYFLWLYSIVLKDRLKQNSENMESIRTKMSLLVLFPLFFGAIEYWSDADNGHWEEERKIEASSIGAVVAGLKALRDVLLMLPQELAMPLTYNDKSVNVQYLDMLIAKGRNALDEILPFECIQPDTERKYDAALLFLIYPLQLIEGPVADQVLHNVINHLQGPYGIRRYLKDSFWAADYRTKVSLDQRTTNVSDDMSARDALIQEGQEAQWCIFDPIVSCIYGLKYRLNGKEADLDQQMHYLNRSLGQLTSRESIVGPYKSPELYFLEEGNYVHNDATPLLWSQSNLMVALNFIRENLKP